MNQRIDYFIANQVAVDLSGPRGTQHTRCAFGSLVALLHVPVRLDENLGFTPPFTCVNIPSHAAASQFFGAVLFSHPHVLFASRTIFVALGSAECLFSRSVLSHQ